MSACILCYGVWQPALAVGRQKKAIDLPMYLLVLQLSVLVFKEIIHPRISTYISMYIGLFILRKTIHQTACFEMVSVIN